MNNTFPMGFWGTQSIDDVPLTDVADWAACGMTLTVAPHYRPDPVRKQKLIDFKNWWIISIPACIVSTVGVLIAVELPSKILKIIFGAFFAVIVVIQLKNNAK